jgi:hypothetical protein
VSENCPNPSRRQELLAYLESGRLRDDVARGLSVEAQDLLIDIVARYCEHRRPKRKFGNR